jgi:hypothetical protein
MKAQSISDNRTNQIAHLLELIERVNKRIVDCENDDDALGIWQYRHQKQDFLRQLNTLMSTYQLQVLAAAA